MGVQVDISPSIGTAGSDVTVTVTWVDGDTGGQTYDVSYSDSAGGLFSPGSDIIGDDTSGFTTVVSTVYSIPGGTAGSSIDIHVELSDPTYSGDGSLPIKANPVGPYAVKYQPRVAPSHPIRITAGPITDDFGGQTWTLTYTDNGAGGSFSPASVQIGDTSSAIATSAFTLYTPSSSEGTVTLTVFGSNNDPISGDLAFTMPAALIKTKTMNAGAFMSYFI